MSEETVSAVAEDDLPPEPDVEHLITEDDEPVDNPFSEKQQRLLVQGLYSSWSEETRQGRPFVAFANVGLFFTPKEPAIVPDVQVSLDVELPEDIWAKKNRAYMTWVYGKPPELVIEIVSNRKGNEAGTKFSTYAAQGIAYYAIFDPERVLSKRPLRAFELHGREYVELLDPGWMMGARLGLTLWSGVFESYEAVWLRWKDERGELLPLPEERLAQAEQKASEAEQKASEAEQKASEAEQKANEAEQRARAAELEAARLAERLRQLEGGSAEHR